MELEDLEFAIEEMGERIDELGNLLNAFIKASDEHMESVNGNFAQVDNWVKYHMVSYHMEL